MAQRSREQGLQSSPPGRGAVKEMQMQEDRSGGGGKGQAMKDGTMLWGAGVRRRLSGWGEF